MSKEFQNSDLIYVNLITDVFKIIVEYHRKIIAKYLHLLPSVNRALETFVPDLVSLTHPSLQILGKTQTGVFLISGFQVSPL